MYSAIVSAQRGGRVRVDRGRAGSELERHAIERKVVDKMLRRREAESLPKLGRGLPRHASVTRKSHARAIGSSVWVCFGPRS
jgi:hypothetical protein